MVVLNWVMLRAVSNQLCITRDQLNTFTNKNLNVSVLMTLKTVNCCFIMVSAFLNVICGRFLTNCQMCVAAMKLPLKYKYFYTALEHLFVHTLQSQTLKHFAEL